MDELIRKTYAAILNEELMPALGCTEPIAIALAGARARTLLGMEPEHITVHCSGNIIKNAQSVVVPTTGDLRGIGTAAVLGAVGGDPGRGLEVLSAVRPEHLERTRALLAAGICRVVLLESPSALHIRMEMEAGGHTALCEIRDTHTNVIRLERDDQILMDEQGTSGAAGEADRSLLSLAHIWDYCRTADLSDVRAVLERQIACNTAVSAEGLHRAYGAQVGRTLLEQWPECVQTKACAAAAAGSDARMGGCVLPVVINSGSGNQGITVSLPVVTYARHWGSSHDELLRALAFSNLTALLQKREIGRLSAFCGVVSAGCGAAAGVAFLHGDSLEVIGQTIVNTLGTIGGMVCDGAKPSCAAKIASAVHTALMGYEMARQGQGFHDGEGIVRFPAERTVSNAGRMARQGMAQTDQVILGMMLEP